MSALDISSKTAKDPPADMCSEILIQILNPSKDTMSTSKRTLFYPNVLVEENLTARHKKILDLAEQQLQCPEVDLKYQDADGFTVEQYVAIWNSPRLNKAIEKYRKKSFYLHGEIDFFISEPGTRFLSDLYKESWSPRENFKPLNKNVNIIFINLYFAYLMPTF